MHVRRTLPAFVLFVALGCLVAPLAQRAPAPAPEPGSLGHGVTLLPNGWKIAPAGEHLTVGDLPLALVPSPDGRYVIVSNNGYGTPTLAVVDLRTFLVTERTTVRNSWLGLAFHPDGKRLFVSTAAEGGVRSFNWDSGSLKGPGAAGGFVWGRAGQQPRANAGFVGGLAVSHDGRFLYAVDVFGCTLAMFGLGADHGHPPIDLPAEPYSVLLSRDDRMLFVSLWGGAKVLMLDATTLETRGDVAVGEHPNAMVLSADGTRLFVACANTNAVWVIDVASKSAREQISVALYPEAPAGTTPNALDLSPDGTTLAVANADNNTVALVDVSTSGASRVKGWLPVGWYPTGVLFDRDGQRLYVLSGKGLTSQANPRGSVPGTRGPQFIGGLLTGTLSRIAVPDAAALNRYTRRVYALTPYTDVHRLSPAGAPVASPVPRRVGRPSPIKYVFYVIRENRTYDQVFGDLPQGNGDPNLAILGEEVTPNAHALAREFVLLDNFYVDAEVSYDGHAFLTSAMATDVVEKLWPANYADRGAPYLSEGGGPMRNAYGNLSAPAGGYLWDVATRHGVTVRSYGEFAHRDEKTKVVTAAVPGLEGLVSPDYEPYNLDASDLDRVEVWRREFAAYERNGSLPRLNIIRLPNDHTNGTVPHKPTPRAYVAQNDLALGRLVETISTSRYWKESVIFVLEDDAQNGSDHVDAHRSLALVVSPFTRHRTVDHTMYTTCGVLRTLELILGLPPMSQYDAAARPLYNAFRTTPNPAPFRALPARVSLEEKNGPDAPGAKASMAMDFSDADRTPEVPLNEIIWKSIRGAQSPMPPPVRTGFIRSVAAGVDRDDD